MKILKDKIFIWSVIFLLCVIVGITNHVIYNPGDYYNLYSAKVDKPPGLDFHFTNASHLFEAKPYTNYYFKSSDNAHPIVGDLDNDGFDDFIFLSKEGRRPLVKIQRNQKGAKFISDRMLEKVIWKIIQKNNRISTLAIVDIDNDSRNDIVIVHNGCVSFLKNNNGNFKPELIPTLCGEGDKRNINLLDVNNDGFIDIYFSSFQPNGESWIPPSISNGDDSGKNILFLNIDGKSFQDVTDEYGLGSKRLSWTAALSDFNKDGYTDIMDINDFGYNTFYLNDKGKKFINKTKEALDLSGQTYSMSGEVGDFNNDGHFDVYVSNTNRPTLLSGHNYMFINNGQGVFTDEAHENRTSACGWSWGAKSFEPNRDGNTAILVVNAPSQPINQMERSSLYSSPVFLRRKIQDLYGEILPNANFVNLARFPQKNCLFYKIGKEYVDIAETVGIKDISGGKGLSEIDFNNDGVSDFIISNIDQPPILYQGHYTGKNQWIGFSLIGTKSNRNAIGSVITVEYKNSFKKKQLFPTNGFQSQSTLKMLFGIPVNDEINKISIRWPSGKKQELKNYELNKYNIVSED